MKSVLGFLLLLLALCGTLGRMVAGDSFGGLLISTVVGFIGAWVGLWIARNFDLPEWVSVSVDGRSFPIVWAIIGSALLAALVGLTARPSYS